MVTYGPLIDRTHQAWKLHAANAGVVLAIFIHVIPRWLLGGVTAREIAIYSGVSAVIAALSVFIFFGTIRCPACGANWMWQAIKERTGGWLSWFHEQQVCPVCGSGAELPPN